KIVKQLPDKFQARCTVNHSHLAPRALIQAFGECDAFIGMRLHGCLLSMLGGTPAMGVGYEPKTREIFNQLGLEAFQIPFEADAAKAIAELERLRREGAAFIVFASPCFWWLEHYTGFHSHLQQQYQPVFRDDELIVFELRKAF